VIIKVHLAVCHTLSSDHLPVLIDTICRASFNDPLDRPDLTWTDWVTFQASLKDRLPGNPAVHDEEAINKCVKEMTSAIQVVLMASAPKSRPCTDTRPPLPASIRDGIRLKYRLRRQWQVTKDPAVKALVNCFHNSVTYKLNEWRNEQWSNTLESLDSEDQVLWKMTKGWCEFHSLEALADSLEAQFQPVGASCYWDS
jgi:hypothetical protein